MSKNKSGTPPCGIYVRIDDYADMPKTITGIRQMAMVVNQASGYEKNMDVVELAYGKDMLEQINDLITIIKAQGFIAIVSGVGAVHAEIFPDADGFLTDDTIIFSALKKALPEEAIIGLSGLDVLGRGADFVIVKADPSVIVKAASGENPPLLCARGHGITNDNIGALATAGASFVDVTDYIFTHKKGVMQGTVNILHALELAFEGEELLKN